jgi:hypothetical protein
MRLYILRIHCIIRLTISSTFGVIYFFRYLRFCYSAVNVLPTNEAMPRKNAIWLVPAPPCSSTHSDSVPCSRNCQTRHLRCVREPDSDRCRRCTIGDLVCVKDSTFQMRNVVSRVRKNSKRSKNPRDLDYDEDQVWVPIPPRCKIFPASQNQHCRRLPATLTYSVNFEQHDGSEEVYVETAEGSEEQVEQEPSSQPQHTSPSISVVRSTHSAQNDQEFDVHSNPVFSPSVRFLPSIQTYKSPLYEPGLSWPFETSHEAQLFLHYVQRLAGWVKLRKWFLDLSKLTLCLS